MKKIKTKERINLLKDSLRTLRKCGYRNPTFFLSNKRYWIGFEVKKDNFANNCTLSALSWTELFIRIHEMETTTKNLQHYQSNKRG